MNTFWKGRQLPEREARLGGECSKDTLESRVELNLCVTVHLGNRRGRKVRRLMLLWPSLGVGNGRPSVRGQWCSENTNRQRRGMEPPHLSARRALSTGPSSTDLPSSPAKGCYTLYTFKTSFYTFKIEPQRLRKLCKVTPFAMGGAKFRPCSYSSNKLAASHQQPRDSLWPSVG